MKNSVTIFAGNKKAFYFILFIYITDNNPPLLHINAQDIRVMHKNTQPTT